MWLAIGEDQCSTALTAHINAPVDIVWSLVRRFDQSEAYKPFVSKCTMNGELKIGSLREVNVKSGPTSYNQHREARASRLQGAHLWH